MRLITQSGNPLCGILEDDLPGDKSISHRAALFAALAEGESRFEHFQVSGVTHPMLNALTALGVDWELQGETLTVIGKGLRSWKTPVSPVDCGNSATTLRLLAGAVSAAGVSAILDGSTGLRKRPMERIVEPLQQMGVTIHTSPQGTAPLHLASRSQTHALHSIEYELPVASAQVKSCLILAALSAAGSTVLSEPGPSRDHTERMLSSMGVKIETREHIRDGKPMHEVKITPPDPMILGPLQMTLPGDPSAAAFLVVGALLVPGSKLELRGICLNPTRSGLFEALRQMGADIQIQNEVLAAGEPVGDLLVKHSPLHGINVHGDLVVRMIDEFPIFAVAAALAIGETVVRDAQELRLKESDRIAKLGNEIRRLGVDFTDLPDGFIIQGGKIAGGEVDAHADHRLAMSLAVAGLTAQSPVRVTGAECITESFPGFVNALSKLGAKLIIEDDKNA